MSETIEAILRQLQHCLTEHKRCSTHKHAIVKDRHNGTVQFYCGYIPAGKLIFKITDDHLKYGLTPARIAKNFFLKIRITFFSAMIAAGLC